MRLLSAVFVLAVFVLPTGCTSMPVPPTYTEQELAQKCAREGGVWRPHIPGGHCEYESPGFL